MIDGLQPFPKYRDSGVDWLGRIPASWRVVRIKTLLRECDDRTATGREPLLSLRMRVGLVDHARAGGRFIPPNALIGYKRTSPGQIVMNRMRASTGLFGVTPSVGLVSPDYAVFQVDQSVDPHYYVRLFQTPLMARIFRAESTGLGTGESGFLRLYSDRFGTLAVPLPPTDEQHSIVRFLVHAERKTAGVIKAKQQLVQLLNEQRETILRSLVGQGPSGEAGLIEQPLSTSPPFTWSQRKLRHCGAIVGGMTPSMAVRSYWNGAIPWVTPKDMKRSELSDAQMRVTERALSSTSLRLLPSGSVLIVVRGMILARRIPVALTTSPLTINQDMKAIIPSAGMHPGFLSHAVRAARPTLSLLIDESGHGTRRLPTERWKDVSIPVPPWHEQLAVVELVQRVESECDRAIARTKAEIDLLREYQTRLMSDVVLGRTDVRAAAARLQNESGSPELCESADRVVSGYGEPDEAEADAVPEGAEA